MYGKFYKTSKQWDSEYKMKMLLYILKENKTKIDG